MADIEYQIVISKNGHRLAVTEWSADKEAICEVQNSINNECRDLKAIVDLRGKSTIEIKPVMMKG